MINFGGCRELLHSPFQHLVGQVKVLSVPEIFGRNNLASPFRSPDIRENIRKEEDGSNNQGHHS